MAIHTDVREKIASELEEVSREVSWVAGGLRSDGIALDELESELSQRSDQLERLRSEVNDLAMNEEMEMELGDEEED